LAWGETEFFKQVTKVGKDFETLTVIDAFAIVTRDQTTGNILTAIRNTSSSDPTTWYNKLKTAVGKELDEYDMYSQVQLSFTPQTLSGVNAVNIHDFFVADQVFIKWKQIGNSGTYVIDDYIIVENKIKNTTRLTSPQTIAKNQVSSFKVQSHTFNLKPTCSGVTGSNIGKPLTYDFEIPNQPSAWVKVWDHNDGKVITGVSTF
jgi:hypothetical protein